MKNQKPSKVISLFFVCVFALTACGGSGTSTRGENTERPDLGPSTPSPSTGSLDPIIEDSNVQIFGSLNTVEGAAIGFSIIPKTTRDIRQVRWTQTSGPLLNFLAPNSQTIGFDVPAVGSYSLQISVTLDGSTEPLLYDLAFSALNAPSQANPATNIRLDHSVSELGKVSLHVGASGNKTIADVIWQQVAGPQVNDLETIGDFLFFDAPAVEKDDVIMYRANVNYTDGTSGTDEVLLTVNNIDFDENGLFYNNGTIISDDLYSANDDSPYKASVEQCVYNNRIPSTPTCTFAQLPLIGSTSQSNTPTVEEILDRTLVSHPWMAERFKLYLENSAAGEDMRNLLRGVTAIVISYDVRPSFYWAATGAIYLDANNFWQTPQERDTLNDAPDYRSSFGSELQFRVLWRYTKDNEYYPNNRYDKQSREERSFADVEASISWLMYHELAHANDFFPSSSWTTMNTNTTPLRYANQNGTNSDILDLRYPLRSSEMHALAQVRFRNESATSVQKNYSGEDVAYFFSPDIAPSFYAYLTTREDFATMFERYMMLYRLDAEADVAISDSESIDDYGVSWGQRNRISDESLADRAVFVVNRVYPELQDVRSQLADLPGPIFMDTSEGWFDNIDISPANTGSVESRKQVLNKSAMKARFKFDDMYDLHLGKPTTLN